LVREGGDSLVSSGGKNRFSREEKNSESKNGRKGLAPWGELSQDRSILRLTDLDSLSRVGSKHSREMGIL